LFTAAIVVPSSLHAQWLNQATPELPRTADGAPDLNADPPQTADGRTDLSGLWQTAAAGPAAVSGVDGRLRSPFFTNVLAAEENPPYQPWAEAERQRRQARYLVDDPVARCLPAGLPAATTYPLPFKIVQTPTLLLILYERNSMFRQVFLDGRALPSDPQPTWMGYSVGRWD